MTPDPAIAKLREIKAGHLKEAQILQWRAEAFQSAIDVIQEEIGSLSYFTRQKTNCAVCKQHKHTPLRRDEMGGYVCLTCIDAHLDSLMPPDKIEIDEA